MPEKKEDLWQEFNEELDESSGKKKVSKSEKKSSTDGSEWEGRFDRRRKPRDQDDDASE